MLYIVHKAYTKPIHNMIERSVQRSENRRTLVPTGSTLTHKHFGIESSLSGSTGNSKSQMHSHSPENGQYLHTNQCKPNRGNLFTWSEAYLPWDWCLQQVITLIASLLARHQQPSGRPGVKGDDDIGQVETALFSSRFTISRTPAE